MVLGVADGVIDGRRTFGELVAMFVCDVFPGANDCSGICISVGIVGNSSARTITGLNCCIDWAKVVDGLKSVAG